MDLVQGRGGRGGWMPVVGMLTGVFRRANYCDSNPSKFISSTFLILESLVYLLLRASTLHLSAGVHEHDLNAIILSSYSRHPKYWRKTLHQTLLYLVEV